MDRSDALKKFHDGGDALADLIDEHPPADLPAPDSDVPMVSRWRRTTGSARRRSPGGWA